MIWTLRRTGGTTLTAFINSLSEFPTVEHEPFNLSRHFGAVTQAWRDTKDEDELRLNLMAALADRPLIKHCCELVPNEVNACLMQVTTELGYRHVILRRDDEVGRILSLELAKLSGVWGKRGSYKTYEKIKSGELELGPVETMGAVEHLIFCNDLMQDVSAGLAELGVVPFEAVFEDIYGTEPPERGRRRVRQLLRFLDIDPREHKRYGARLREALEKKGQNSARVMDLVPNIKAARSALQAALSEIRDV